ncbi:MAG: hypothetical protein KDE59_26270 [Anaerolineales bacterium]|nr:hypothetical protein [Anaerolineales bacterium]
MIRLTGARQLTFLFPAERPVAFAFYRTTLRRLAAFLPHIDLLNSYADDHALLTYKARELATYEIRMVFEVGLECDESSWLIRVAPRGNKQKVKAQAALNHTVGWGYYQSESRFEPAGDQTRIHYTVALKGELPTPTSMRLMPGIAIDRIAQSITGQRIDEIAQGFVQNSITAYVAGQPI